MKRLEGLILAVCFFLVVSILSAEGIYTLRFNESELTFGKRDGFDIIDVKECIPSGDSGMPLLPKKRIEILIPSNRKFVEVKILNRVLVPLNGNFKLYPAQPPLPLNMEVLETQFVINEETYALSNPFPETSVIFIEEERIAGNRLVALNIIPLVYIPKENHVFLVKEVTFELILNESYEPIIQPLKRTAFSQHFVNETIESRIFNKEEFANRIYKTEIESFNNHNPAEKLTKPSFEDLPKDFIIITDDNLSQAFEHLAEIKGRRGIITTIVTTEWIKDNYQGRDLPERIRNFIKDAYIYWGISWVLLGGEITIVPTRFANFKSWEYYGKVPTDLYYSDLDGDWDADGDGFFAEYENGSNIDSVDGNPDILVGRIPVESIEEIDAYFQRVYIYEFTPDTSYISKVLFLGASIFSNGTDGWGALKSEYIIENYIPSNIEPYRLYAPQIDSLQDPPRWIGDEVLNSINTISNINQGYNIINHIDHGAIDAIGTGIYNGGGWFRRNDADGLTNSTKPSILWTISCSPNAYDMNSVSEHFVNSQGGLAFIGNSRTGWTSQAFQDYAFFKSIYSDSITNLGAAFATTLYNSLYYRISMNLLGDPSIFIWTDVPCEIDVDYKKTLFIPVDSILFSVSSNGEPLKNARVVLTKEDEGIKRIAITDYEGKASIYLKCKSPGKVNISVSSINSFPYFESVTVYPSQKPYLSLVQEEHTLRPGSKSKMSILVKNAGEKTAERAQAIVSSSDPYVTIRDSILKLGDIQPLAIVSSNFFTIKISENCPPKIKIEISCNIFDRNNNNWIDTLLLLTGDDSLSYRGHSPLVINSVSPFDSSLKTIYIPSVNIKNNGDLSGKGIDVYLRTSDSLVTMIDSVIHVDSIPAHTEIESENGFSFNSYCGLGARFTIEIRDNLGKYFVKSVEFDSPSKIDSVDSESKQNSIKIVWEKSFDNDILGYYIYREEHNNWMRITEEPITFLSYEDFNIIQGEFYTYSVAAVDSSFNESPFSEPTTTSSNPPLLPGWPGYIGPGGYSVYSGRRFYDMSSPAYGDLNGDGTYEMVVGSNDGNIYVFNYDGNHADGWPKDIGFRIENSPALADLDNDGIDEIIIGGGAFFDSVTIYIFRGDGSTFLPGKWPKTGLGEIFSSPIVADIDSDGEFEIGIGTLYYVYFWNTDGTLIDGWPVNVIKPVSIATADIDGDTEMDVVVATKNGQIYVFSDKGNPKPGWPQTPGGGIYSGLSLADLDEDGKVEIIVGTSQKKLFVYQPDGTIKAGWPVSVGNRIGGIPAIGEVDGTPGLEIAVSTITNQIYVFKHTGELIFSKNEDHQISNYFISPLLVDINNDEKKDLIVSTMEGNLYAYDSNGSYVSGFPIFYGNGSYSSAAVGDIDRNGSLNLILKGSDKKIYVWDIKNSRVPTQERWYRLRANNRNTCFYNEEIRDLIAKQENVREKTKRLFFHHPFPNPFSSKVNMRFCAGQNAEKVELKIYDISGRLVEAFSLPTPYSLLPTEVMWDGKTTKGRTVSSGVYFVKLTIASGKDKHTFIRKIIKISSKRMF